MEPTSIAAISAIIISALTFAIQGWRFVQELRERAQMSADEATKSGAERDSIAIKGAEGALLMMQGLLEVAKMSEGELRQRVRDLEEQSRAKDKRIHELEVQHRDLQEQLNREREDYAIARQLFEDRVAKTAAEYELKLAALAKRLTVLEDDSDDEPKTNFG